MKIENIDKFILDNFTSSFMNNSKWEKLLDSLLIQLGEIHINYKLVYEEKAISTHLTCTDFKPFFIEPTYYKEVEWIEFPATIVHQKNVKQSKKYFQEINQDIDIIEKIINDTGTYFYENSEHKIRLFAYT